MNHNQAPASDPEAIDTWNRQRSEQKMRQFINSRLDKLVDVDLDI